jgi:hypothetical protein
MTTHGHIRSLTADFGGPGRAPYFSYYFYASARAETV